MSGGISCCEPRLYVVRAQEVPRLLKSKAQVTGDLRLQICAMHAGDPDTRRSYPHYPSLHHDPHCPATGRYAPRCKVECG